MQWLSVHIDTNHEGLEALTAFLSGQGIDEITVEDEEEFQEFLTASQPHWDYVDPALHERMRGRSRVTFYIPADESGFTRLGEVRTGLSDFKQQVSGAYGTLLMSLDELQEADWENNWKVFYKPLPVGERLMILPAWEQIPAGGRIPIIIDPGLTFGTGSHASTRLCLEALEKRMWHGARVLDLGCGSGILSIAALKLGAFLARGVDIDDKCASVAVGNAALNGITREFSVFIGDILTDEALRQDIGGGYDVVLANIVADVIIGLCPYLSAFLRPNGCFICSGVIDGREQEVRRALENAGITIWESRQKDDWHAFTATLGNT